MRNVIDEIERVWSPLPVPSFAQLTGDRRPGASGEATLASEFHQDNWYLCHLFLNKRFDELDCLDRELFGSDTWPLYMESHARWYYAGGYFLCAARSVEQPDPYLTRDHIDVCVNILRQVNGDEEKWTPAQLSVALDFLRAALLWIDSHEFACHPSLGEEARELIATLDRILRDA